MAIDFSPNSLAPEDPAYQQALSDMVRQHAQRLQVQQTPPMQMPAMPQKKQSQDFSPIGVPSNASFVNSGMGIPNPQPAYGASMAGINQLQPSGPGGYVTQADAQSFLDRQKNNPNLFGLGAN